MEDSFIRIRRKELNIGVPEIAEAVGVSETAVWRWDSGQSHPRANKLSALANCLQVTKEELEDRLVANREQRVQADNTAAILDRARARIAEINGLDPEQLVLELKIVSAGKPDLH